VASSPLRPRVTPGRSLGDLAAGAGATAAGGGTVPAVAITGVTLRAQDAVPGDLFAALPGAAAHGAQFVPAALAGGAAAVLTDDEGADRIRGLLGDDPPVPVLTHPAPRAVLGAIAA
jgi:UDP-N-acetylmuramoyl-L-alanyl-D-glutamate--2,6-diaminopimelate ligase